MSRGPTIKDHFPTCNGVIFLEILILLQSGYMKEEYLRELLMTMGDRFTEAECDDMFHGAPIDADGNFNYLEFIRILKHGSKEE